FYTPLTGSDGLHFGMDTELQAQFTQEGWRDSGTARTLDWTQEQHLASGWISPRVPSHFVLRKSEVRRERVTFTAGPEGTPSLVNGLGAEIEELYYADRQGRVFRAGPVPPGGQAVLTPTGDKVAAEAEPLRSVYAGDWLFQMQK